MISSTRGRYVRSADGKKLRTRKQFLQTLEQLGGKPGVSYCHSAEGTREINEVHTGFLSCPLDTWVREFGEPEGVSEHREFMVPQALQCWEKRCTDGLVKCTGRLFERWPDGSWVIVIRVSSPVGSASRRQNSPWRSLPDRSTCRWTT